MNESDRAEASYLRTLSSDQAATYLIERYVDGYPRTISHRSWKVADQLRLAQHFLQGRVYSSAIPYKDFLSFMSVSNFLAVVSKGIPQIPPDDLSLLFYHLVPSLRRVATSDAQMEELREFASCHSIEM